MTIWDDRILEVVREEGSGSPTELAAREEIHVSKSSVSRRLTKLADNDLLQPLANGVYILTDEGEAYLEGKYDAEQARYIDDGDTTERETERQGVDS
jgi:DeoR/GlpR family transcriptional regulator of sugar metabolism